MSVDPAPAQPLRVGKGLREARSRTGGHRGAGKSTRRGQSRQQGPAPGLGRGSQRGDEGLQSPASSGWPRGGAGLPLEGGAPGVWVPRDLDMTLQRGVGGGFLSDPQIHLFCVVSPGITGAKLCNVNILATTQFSNPILAFLGFFVFRRPPNKAGSTLDLDLDL